MRSRLVGSVSGNPIDSRGRKIYGGTGGDFFEETRKVIEAGGFRKLPEVTVSIRSDGTVTRDGKRQGSFVFRQMVIPQTDDYVRAYAKLARDYKTRLLFLVTPISREARFDTTGLVN